MSALTSISREASLTLNELETMDGATDPARQIGLAMASVDVALETTSLPLAASRCVLAAARLIRAAELFSEQDAPRNGEPAVQAGEGAGSDASSIPVDAPSPSPATLQDPRQ